MGVKERQEREREEVQRKIMDAARELFVNEGYRNVSIRKVAERIEYSPAALYGYFASKDDLFFALAEEGFRLMSEYTLADEPPPDPLDAVRHGFIRYYQFSREYPEYFELMFVDRSVPRIGRDWERFAFVHDTIARATAMIQRAIDSGHLHRSVDAEVAFHILWAAVHGAAVARLCERLAPDEDPDALARDTLETALAGLAAGVSTTFKPSACHDPAALIAADRKKGHHGN
jgi:AcrR family transcriptional regulator